MNIEADLSAYLDALDAPAFAYGSHDCARLVAGWVARRTGHDAAAAFAYADEAGAQAHIDAAGGMVPLGAAVALAAGWVPVAAPRFGDVAVVRFLRGDLFGIVAGRHVLAATEGGMARLLKAGILAAWGPAPEAVSAAGKAHG